MSTQAGRPVAVIAPIGTRLRLFVWRRPEWWVVLVAATAWLVLVLAELIGGGRGMASGHHGHHHATGASAGASGATWPAELGGIGLMVVAMMPPLALPAVRHVALTSFWWRRHRAGVLVLVGYLAVWVPVAVALAVVVAAVEAAITPTVDLAAGFATAAAWQLSRTKRRVCGAARARRPSRPGRGRPARTAPDSGRTWRRPAWSPAGGSWLPLRRRDTASWPWGRCPLCSSVSG